MNEETVVARSEDIEPLLPIDIISPPQQRGDFERSDFPTKIEDRKVVDSEIEEKKRAPDYKGDQNAPVDAPHPLANPPEEPE